MSRTIRIGGYLLVGLIAVLELGVLWLMIHPTVSADFRAYYIDKTTTCLNQPVSGAYALGTTIAFTPDGAAAAKLLKVCGWEGPVGDGTHAVGTSSRLRFVYDEPATALTLELEMVAIKRPEQPTQQVDVIVNGASIGSLTVAADAPQRLSLPLPAELVAAAAGKIELELRFPDAVQTGATDPDNRYRSIKLFSAALIPV